ncbi:hypothetical protein [Frigoriglobus tundricola]|uniref:DUF4292 domain-containing protein n=1 Tax=Frigoriglobus tundricola TaxID=2774151 RepID=A0A6M5YUN2_9BACT|nr:hypothetical protein [Frigoriglobus tundricola]QJW96592.1 hypothetical protein FTUN_4149 [Frigoriglobus tundricola]
MKTFGLTLAAAVLLPLAGCAWLKEHMGKDTNADRTGKGLLPKDVQPEKFVSYLNEHAARLRSIAFADVRVTAQDRSGVVPSPPITLSTGDLFASQPRNFCLRARSGGIIDAKVLLGSNNEEFWVYAKVPTVDPMYYFASHTDFAEGRAKLPGGIPFEPEWVLQTLGMITLPLSDGQPELPPGAPTVAPANRYSLKLDKHTYTLSWPAVTPGGTAVIKEIVFEGEPATGSKPQVKKHVIRDAKSNKIICFAEIKTAKTVPIGADPRSGALSVQYPTKMLLRWEEQKFEMELELANAKINQPLAPEEARRLYTRPNIQDVRQINLAGGELPFK